MGDGKIGSLGIWGMGEWAVANNCMCCSHSNDQCVADAEFVVVAMRSVLACQRASRVPQCERAKVYADTISGLANPVIVFHT